jgi:hypothetical protein
MKKILLVLFVLFLGCMDMKIEFEPETMQAQKIEKATEATYIVTTHGLLYIVYKKVYTGQGLIMTEDSRWEDEQKAILHCKLINEFPFNE